MEELRLVGELQVEQILEMEKQAADCEDMVRRLTFEIADLTTEKAVLLDHVTSSDATGGALEQQLHDERRRCEGLETDLKEGAAREHLLRNTSGQEADRYGGEKLLGLSVCLPSTTTVCPQPPLFALN